MSERYIVNHEQKINGVNRTSFFDLISHISSIYRSTLSSSFIILLTSFIVGALLIFSGNEILSYLGLFLIIAGYIVSRFVDIQSLKALPYELLLFKKIKNILSKPKIDKNQKTNI